VSANRCIAIVLLVLLGIPLSWSLIPRSARISVAQTVELTCPTGTVGIQTGQTRDSSTGGIRQYFCVDTNGNLVLNATITPNLNNILFIDGMRYPCSDAGLNAAEAALPRQGGSIITTGCQGTGFNISSQVVFNKPTTLLLGAATWTCRSSIGAAPCFAVTKPSHIIGLGEAVPRPRGGATPDLASKIMAGSGFTNYLMGIFATGDWADAIFSSVDNVSLDGNNQAASGVECVNTYGCTFRSLNINNPQIGVLITSTGRQYSEGSSLERLWIFAPKSYGVYLASSSSSPSAANAVWRDIHINLTKAGSVCIGTDTHALFKNSVVDYVKCWLNSSSNMTQTALAANANMDGTVFTGFNVETEMSRGSNPRGIFVAHGINQPSILNYVTQGFPTVTNQFGATPFSSASRQLASYLNNVSVGGDATFSASPRPPLSCFLPSLLTSTWTGCTFTLDRAISVTRIQVQAKTRPVMCTTNAIVRLTDGTSPQDVTIALAANDSGSITQNYVATAVLTVAVQRAAMGCGTSPADANVIVQYRMQ
jgi:hypothetical protein